MTPHSTAKSRVPRQVPRVVAVPVPLVGVRDSDRRYDKLASTYRAAVLLRAILLWLPALTEWR